MKALSAGSGRWPLLIALSLTLTSCGGGGGGGYGGSSTPPPATYTVGGTVSGLSSGHSVALLDNGGDSTTVSSNTTFTFPTALASGAQYAVTVGTQPTGETCAVTGGSGTIGMSGITSVIVTCASNTGSNLELAYVTNSSPSTISGFTINTSTGALTLTPGSPYAGSGELFSIAIDPAKRFAFSVATSGYIIAFAIDPASGALLPLGGGPYFTGATPIAITVDPSSHFVFSANSGGNSISAFSISQSGILTEIIGSPFAAGSQPAAIVFEPQGKFLYVANELDKTISAYSMSAATGQLTAISGSPFATGGTYPQSIAIDPSGASLYVANTASNTIAGFTIDSVSGALTPITGSPYSESAIAVVVD